MTEPVKANCAECGKERILNSPRAIKHHEKGWPIYCQGCADRIHYKLECWSYSKKYRCPNRGCIGEISLFSIEDGDEDYTELSCCWCGETFRIYHPIIYPEEYYYCPSPEDDQKMVDEYHLHKYGEY